MTKDQEIAGKSGERVSAFAYRLVTAWFFVLTMVVAAMVYWTGALLTFLRLRSNPLEGQGLEVAGFVASIAWGAGFLMLALCAFWLRRSDLRRRWLALAALALGILLLSTPWWLLKETDQWLGQWNGPEGTFLRLEGGQGNYQITIQDLDGPRTYQGKAVGEQVQFERNGKTETIRASNGAETGMKWLSDKTNCLTIRYGEGFCRD